MTKGAARDLSARDFGEFVRIHDHRFRGVAWAVVRNSDQTDDVMQAAYEKAFRALPDFDGRSALTTWIHAIVYRTALDHLRFEGRRRHSDLSEVGEAGNRRADVAQAVLARIELEAALDQLAPQERAALMLISHLGFSYDEAAQILGEPRGTVAARVGRARARLERWSQ